MLRLIKSKKGIAVMLLILMSMVVGLSYSVFVISTNKYQASEMLVSNLVYGINIEPTNMANTTVEGKTVRVLEGSTTTILVKITSLNPVESKYSLEYKVNEGVANVYYSYSTGWLPSGKINKNGLGVYEKTVKVVIKAISESKVEFNVSGGYTYNDAPDTIIGYSKIEEEYDRVEIINEGNLKEIIETNTTNNTYGGESKNNYLEYNGLWRILRVNEEGIKLISNESTSKTEISNIASSLSSIYNTLTDRDKYVHNTNKFNCSLIGCIESSYNNVGLISTYEYELIGGLNSYLSPTESYFSINNSNIMNITRGGIEETTEGTISGIRPSIYLTPEVNVTGSGTVSDPYRIISVGKIIRIKYKVNGEIREIEPLKSDPYIVDKVECTNGAEGKWDEEASTVVLTKEKYPTTCTVNFKEGYAVALTGSGVSIEAPTNKTVGRIGETTFNVTANSGYTLTNSSLSCPSATIERNNNIITITNIKENQTCTINAVELPKVTLTVNNGTGSTTKTAAAVGGSLTFSIGANNGYTITNASKSCNGGASISISGSTVTVSNINSTQTCTVSTIALPKVTLVVNNGTGSATNYATSVGGTSTFTGVYPNEGYTATGSSISCTGSAVVNTWFDRGTITVENITSNQTCTITMVKDIPAFTKKLLADNPNVSTRTSFDNIYTGNTANTIYKVNGELTENAKDVYYFAGGETSSLKINNWVKFGKDSSGNNLYWRIIRTNEDGSVRLLYAGSSNVASTSVPTMTNAVINTSTRYNSTYDNTMYVGYMYGSIGSLNSNRGLDSNGNYTGTLTDSGVKKTIDTWYGQGLNTKTDGIYTYDKYISKTAIYCNDRSSGQYASTGYMSYAGRDRLYHNSAAGRQPSYKCGYNAGGGYTNTGQSWTTLEKGMYSNASNADRFSASTTSSNGVTGGNGKLQYPVALMTADEVSFAGGLYNTNNPTGWYYYNAALASATGSTWWWTMSPFCFFSNGRANVWYVLGSSYPGNLSSNYVSTAGAVRPVVSLKSCVTVTGSGTVVDPYVPGISSTCASNEN